MIACISVLDRRHFMPKQPAEGNLVEFGNVLDQLLSERGWNQTQLSAETDPEVSQGQLSNYRYGRRRPKPETIEVIACALTPRSEKKEEEEKHYYRILNSLRHAAGLRQISGNGFASEAVAVADGLTHEQKLKLWESMGARTYYGSEPNEGDFELSENPEEWPPDLREALQEALFYTRLIPAEFVKTVFQLWRDQARAHAGVAVNNKVMDAAMKENKTRKN